MAQDTPGDAPADAIVSEQDGILLITLNRPEAKNAATLAAAKIIASAIDDLDRRDDLRIGILTGAGGTFCAGMDLKKFLEGERPTIPGRGFLGFTESQPRKPLIAAVEGYALAGGCEAALACDMIVASRTAKFGIPEIKRGLFAAGGGLMRLPRQMPERIAMELALTGDMFDAERAYHYGLINHLTDEGGALEGALDLARRITVNAPLSIEASKRIILESRDWRSDEMFDKQRPLVDQVFSSEDAKEGSRAFAEKRAPVWNGK